MRFFKQIKSWQKLFLWLGFIFFLASLLLRQDPSINQDLGRHIRLGKAIMTDKPAGSRRAALATNYLTYTFPDYPFVNHHWGSEVIFFEVYKASGFEGLVWLKSIVLGLALIITVLNSSKGKTGLAMAMGFVFLSAQMMEGRLIVRPEMFGYLLFAGLFWFLARHKTIDRWSLAVPPLVMAVWVNLHITFAFGLGLVWLWAITKVKSSRQERDRRQSKVKSFLTGVGATLATLINPAGIKGALQPLNILKDYGYTIVENMTPFFLRAFKPQPEYTIYVVLLILAAMLLIFQEKRNWFHLSALLAFSIFPLMAVRHLPFFALVIPVVLTPLITQILKLKKIRYFPMVIAGGLLVTGMTNPVLLSLYRPHPREIGVDKRHFRAVEFVKSNNFSGNMWNNYDIGSFLEWAMEEHPTFVDGRPEAFPYQFLQEVYIPMQKSKAEWDRRVVEYDLQWAFAALTDATPWFKSWWQMIQNHENWRQVYRDESTVVLVRNDGINAQIEPDETVKLQELLKSF